jgi:hypothetical protein
MDNRKDVTVPMPATMVEKIENELGYGDSRAEWIRQAIRLRLAAELADGGDSNGEKK